MKQISYLFLALLVGLCSCNSENDYKTQPKESSISLNADEAIRMGLLMNNTTRDASQILEAAKGSTIITKGTMRDDIKIVDSIVSGSHTKSSTSPLVIYVVSNGDGLGYTLVNKDTRLTPIVGVVESGNFDPNGGNPASQIVLSNIIEYQIHLRDSIEGLRGDKVYDDLTTRLGLTNTSTKLSVPGDEGDNRPTMPWDRYEVIEEANWQVADYMYGPLLKTKWTQDYPFNSLIPCGHPAGCTATSAAQIMAYYKYPASSPVSGLPYNWSTYSNYYYGWTPQAAQNVGELMKDLGSNGYLNMQYNAAGSFPGSLNCTNTPRTFEKYGYYGGAHRKYSYEAVIPDISSGRPVHICGKAALITVDWHTWVLDGVSHYSSFKRTATKFYYQGQLVHTIYQDYIMYTSAYVHHNFG